MDNLFDVAARCIAACDIGEKQVLTRAAATAWREGRLSWEERNAPAPIAEPGRPSRPDLVPPRAVPQRKLGHPQGRAALLHAIAHIEFNAVNLAWDAVYRFRGLPKEYYDDWVRVADEEAYHFSLLQQRLQSMGHAYGDFPAHNSLWEMAVETAHDPLIRMALVPRVLEARGLDVTPRMIQRLRQAGDDDSAAVLEIILREEIGHVAIGTRWFRHMCTERGLQPEATFLDLVKTHTKGVVKGPFQRQLRAAAGFTRDELQGLEEMERSTN